MCNGITTFEVWAVFRRFFVSSWVIKVLGRFNFPFARVWGFYLNFRTHPTKDSHKVKAEFRKTLAAFFTFLLGHIK
jgi:hypothetical protein